MMFRISPALEQQRQQRTAQIADTTGAMASISWRRGVVASVIRRMNEVTIHWAR